MPFATILDLPPELLAEITALVAVSTQDLRRLRCVNKAFHSHATPGAFKKIRVHTTDKTARGFFRLLYSPDIVKHIQAITLVEDMSHASVSAVEDTRYLLVRDVLQNALGALHRVPSLRSLTLSFNPEIWAMYPTLDSRALSQCFLLQREVLGAMAQNPNRLPALQSLTINNWLAVPDTLYAETPFARIVASLRHLRFLVCVDRSYDSLRRERFATFWKHVIEQKVLVPARRLESLDVDCNMRVRPSLNFNLFTYPRLTALSLGNIIWEDGSAAHGNFLPGVENFVVRHGKKLRELKLCRCTIEIPEGIDAPFRSWAAIWNRFADELTELVDLVVEFEADPHREDEGIQYSKCYGLYGHVSIYQQVGTGADTPALEAFRTIVEARKSKLGRKLDE